MYIDRTALKSVEWWPVKTSRKYNSLSARSPAWGKATINTLPFHFLSHCTSWKIVAGFHVHIIIGSISPNGAPVVRGHTSTCAATLNVELEWLQSFGHKSFVACLRSSFSSLEHVHESKPGGAVTHAWDALWCCPWFQKEGLVTYQLQVISIINNVYSLLYELHT